MSDSFVQGYVCAVATLVRVYDAQAEADYLLSALAPIKWRTTAEVDRKWLRDGGLVLKKYTKRHP